jgi:hypothetical protein
VVSTWWWRRRTATPASITTAAPASTRCRSAARAGGDSFSYPAILGASLYARAATGATPKSFFIGKTIAEPTQALCSLVFEATSAEVMEMFNTDLPQEVLKDPATLPADHPIVRRSSSSIRMRWLTAAHRTSRMRAWRRS